MAFYNNVLAGSSAQSSGYEIERGLRFDSDSSSHLLKNISTKTTRFCLSFWVKRSKITSAWQYLWSAYDGSNYCGIAYETGGDRITLYNGSHNYTTALFRDTSAWYHIFLTVTDGTANLYINNQLHGSATGFFIGGGNTRFGTFVDGAHQFSGYIADVQLVDGESHGPGAFAEADPDSGVWVPKSFEFSEQTTYTSSTITNVSDVHVWESQTFTNNVTYSSQKSSTLGNISNLFDSNTSNAANTVQNGQLDLSWTLTLDEPVLCSTVIMASSKYGPGNTRIQASFRRINEQGTEVGFNSSQVGGSGPQQPNSSGFTYTFNNGPVLLKKISFYTESPRTDSGINYMWLKIDNVQLIDNTPGPFDGKKLTLTNDTALSNFAVGLPVNGTANTVKEISQSSPYSITVTNGSYAATDNTGVLGGATTVTQSRHGWGTNGFHLDLSDNSSNAALGTDSGGNNNTFTVHNLTAAGAIGGWNQSEVWSTTGTITGNGYRATLSYPGVFNGVNNSSDPNCALAASNELDYRYTFNTAITVQTNIEVYFERIGDGSITFNKGESDELVVTSSDVSTSSGLTTYTTTAISTFKNVSIAKHTGPYLIYIKVDGKQLVDSGTADTSAPDIDSLLDTPTNFIDGTIVGGNYATWIPILGANTAATFSNGNLDASSSGNSWKIIRVSIGVRTGKWYAEYTNTGNNMLGLDSNFNDGGRQYFNTGAGNIAVRTSGQTFIDGTNQGTTGSTINDGDTVGLALDLDSSTKTLKVYINGSLDQTINLTSNFDNTEVFFAAALYGTATIVLNCGQRSFKYAPGSSGGPSSDYKSLCTTNLPDPTIADPSTAFEARTYAGVSGASSQTGYNFGPDFLWIKRRNTTNSNNVFDTVRGAGQSLFTDVTTAEIDDSAYMTAFTSDGYSFGTDGGNTDEAGGTYVAWAWDAGTSNTTIAASSLNSSLYNQTQTWSNSLSVNGSWDSGGVTPANAFDGSLSTNARSAGANQRITFDISSSPLTFTDKVEFYHTTFGMDVSVNGGTVIGNPAVNKFVTLASGGGTLNTITFVNANAKSEITAIRVDGKLLVDPNAISTPAIASTVRANPTAGFSIVSYMGNLTAAGTSSIGHGLNAPPSLIISKDRDNSTPWIIQHSSLGNNQYLKFDTDAPSNSSSNGGGTLPKPTSDVFYGSWLSGLNTNGNDHIAYCFAPVESYSAFGSFEGNGSADGPFVALSFQPALVMIKNIDNYGSGYDWFIFDTARDTFNVAENTLKANLNAAETDSDSLDILSNGFKIRANTNGINLNAHTHVYMAFAEHPFKTSRAR